MDEAKTADQAWDDADVERFLARLGERGIRPFLAEGSETEDPKDAVDFDPPEDETLIDQALALVFLRTSARHCVLAARSKGRGAQGRGRRRARRGKATVRAARPDAGRGGPGRKYLAQRRPV